MEGDDAISLQSARNLLGTPVLLKMLINKSLDLLCQLGRLWLMLMALPGPYHPPGDADSLSALYCVLILVTGCFVLVPARLLFHSLMCPIFAQIRYNAFLQDSGVYSSFVASVNGLVTVYSTPGSCPC